MSSQLMFSQLAKRFSPGSESASELQPNRSDGQSADRLLADAALAAQTCLRRSLDLTDVKIWCEVEAGKIVLRGRVPTYSAKHAARALAEKVCGGCKIENRLGVVPYPLD